METGRSLKHLNFAAGTFEFPIRPGQMSARLAEMTDLFASWRFTALTFRFMPFPPTYSSTTPNNDYVVCGFSPEYYNAGTFNEDDIGSMKWSLVMSAATHIPLEIRVPRAALLQTTAKWFESSPSSEDVDSTQGVLIGHTSASSGVAPSPLLCVMIYTIEMTNPVPASLTLARLRAIASDMTENYPGGEPEENEFPIIPASLGRQPQPTRSSYRTMSPVVNGPRRG